jgi:DNA-binding XRE family transcriptional regulator
MSREELRTHLRNRIADHREALSMTQEELAGEVGVTRTTLSRWETDMHLPSPAMLAQLAWVLGCGARDLFPHDYT